MFNCEIMLASFAKITESPRPPSIKKVSQKFILSKVALFPKTGNDSTSEGEPEIHPKLIKEPKKVRSNQQNKQADLFLSAFEISVKVYSSTF